MSEAFRRALDEVHRVWEAADHFDTKALQFLALTSAGFLAGLGIVGRRLIGAPTVPAAAAFECVRWLLCLVGLVTYILFFYYVIKASIGYDLAAPLDPRELAKNPKLLEDDADFERKMLTPIAEAFGQAIGVQQVKVRRFRRALVLLGVSFASFVVAFTLGVRATSNQWSPSMSENDQVHPASEQTPTQPVPSESDSKTTEEPKLGPYVVKKSFQPSGVKVSKGQGNGRDSTDK